MAGVFPSGERESVSSRVSILGEKARRRAPKRANDGATVRPHPAKTESQRIPGGLLAPGRRLCFAQKEETCPLVALVANQYSHVTQLISQINEKGQSRLHVGHTWRCPRPREPRGTRVANSKVVQLKEASVTDATRFNEFFQRC